MTSQVVLPLNDAGAGGPPVIAFPPAGCGPTWFRPLARALSRPVLAVQLPGRGVRIREPVPASLDELVDALYPRVAAVLGAPAAPGAVLLGHSMGALLLFEVARRLCGSVPADALRLVVSGRSPPGRVPTTARHRLPDDELASAMLDLGAAPEAFAEPELRAVVLPMVRADLRLCETHQVRPGPPLPYRITALAGADDPEAPPAAVVGWSRETAARFELHVMPGGHFFLERQFQQLATLLAAT